VPAGEDPDWIVVGHISRPHGTRGEFYVTTLTDHPERTFVAGQILRIGEADGRQPDEFFPPVEVTESRPFRRGFLVRFRGLEDRTRAEFLRNRYLLRSFQEVEPAGEGEFFYHQLLGARVVTVQGRELGTVREVYHLQPADLLEVSDGRREYLIPFTAEVVVEADADEGRIVVDPPEGLLDL
jgi:16S rRNA processing protein RimM